MRTHVLVLHGTLDPAQLWPEGTSDADTLRVRLGEFTWRRRTVSELETAHVVGRVEKPIVEAGVVHVRLEGVDAPELHYRPTPPPCLGLRERTRYDAVNQTFVQPFGKNAARLLAEHLGVAPLPCIVRTEVRSPTDAFDTYGRMIGTVTIRGHDIGQFLLADGYAMPAFYETTPRDQMRAYTKLARAARRHRTNVWRPASVFPKLFRRTCAWHVERAARLTELDFHEWLARQHDMCWPMDVFLEAAGRAAPRKLAEFVRERSELTVAPFDLVFKEAPAEVALTARDGPIRQGQRRRRA